MMRPTIFLTFAILSIQLSGQTAGDGHDADKDALRALGQRYENAINSGNLRNLAEVVEPNASAVFMTGDEVQGIEAMQHFFDGVKKMLGEGSSYTVKLVPDNTEFMGDTAIAKGTCEETANFSSGRQYHYTTRWTAVLRKSGDQWKAVRLHVSLNPFDNPIVAVKMAIRTWIASGVGVIVGLAGALLIGRLRRKSRS